MCFSLFLSCMLFVELKFGDLQFLMNLENFLSFSQILFSASSSFFPFIRAPITYTLFYRSLRLYSFFSPSLFILSASVWIVSIAMSSHFLTLFPLQSLIFCQSHSVYFSYLKFLFAFFISFIGLPLLLIFPLLS